MKPMLATSFTDQDPTGMLMSEKLDGVRFIWTGTEFISKEGNKLNVPSSIVRAMPLGSRVEGEIYGGIGTIQETAGKVKRGDFEGLEFVIFDNVTSGSYDERMSSACIAVHFNQLPPMFRILEQTTCQGLDHLLEFENAILAKGGEGVVLRDASAHYKPWRTPSVLKLKRFKADEATVTGHNIKDGSFKSLSVDWNGASFKLPCKAIGERPAIGAIITFSYCGLTESGKPKCTSFVCVRDYE